MRVVALVLVFLAADVDADLARLRSADPAERLAAVETLRSRAGEAVSDALARLVVDRNGAVREAAIGALGERADETCVRALRRALAVHAKDPDTLPLVVVALGAAGDAGSAGEVASLARKSLARDPRLAEAAIDALGSLRAAESVGALVELLGTAEPVRGGSAARAGHERYVPGIRQSLQEVTGLPFGRTATWEAWWRAAGRDWRPTPLDPAEERGTVRRDDAWRFEVVRPDAERWSFERPKGAALRIRWTGSREEAAFAWLDVLVHAAAEQEPATLGEAARAEAARLREELRDVREMTLGEEGHLGRETAVAHAAVGLDRAGRPTTRRSFLLERNGLLYTISVHAATGVAAGVEEGIESILGSFRLLDR